MIEADRVHSTPPLNSSSIQNANPPLQAPAESVDSFSLQPAIGQPESENLTSESAKPGGGLSRRHMLAALAAGAGAAAAPAVVDPVFELIEAHRASHVAHMAALALRSRLENERRPAARLVSEKPCHDEDDAFEALVAAPAISLHGALAKLVYFQQLASADETAWMVDDRMHVSAFIDSFAASLKNAGVL